MAMVALIKESISTETGLQVQRFSLFLSWWEGWWSAGKNGAGERAKF